MFDWFPDWSGQVCAVVASGSSVDRGDLDALRGRARTIVVNNGYQIAPWADVLYAVDGRWWNAYPAARTFAGLKITADENAAKQFRIQNIRVRSKTDVSAHAFNLESIGLIGHGGNGGFQALNLALQFGSRRIILIGFDMCGDHWHEKHKEPLKNPRAHTLEKWRIRLDAQSEVLKRLGVDVVNASERSALTSFPKLTVDEAFERWGMHDRRQGVGFDGMRDRHAAVRVA